MCGIASTISLSEKEVKLILDEMIHRGMDNQTIQRVSSNTILGHNRLSICDLTEKGNQPFKLNNKFSICNGEIWNYNELKNEYESKGYKFNSKSDNEIILPLYENKSLKKLDGMFSFIIWDEDKLIIGRDWVGKTPLFINESNTIVASEIKSIQKITKEPCRIIPPNSLSVLNTKTKELVIERDYFFNFSNKIPNEKSIDDVSSSTRLLLEKSVKKRMIGEVPIGTCLSGGIDSSVITFLLSKHITNLKSYTINFDENSEDLKQAILFSNEMGIELVEVKVPRDNDLIKKRFLESIEIIEYPSSVQTQVCILQSFIAERMKLDGIKIAFSGEGSDESYGSYGMIRMLSKKPDWSDVRKKMFKKQHYGNLLRGNNTFMKYGTIELRCPFYDTDFLNFTTNLSDELISKGKDWKLPLSNGFKELPHSIRFQEKRAFQKGTNFKDFIEDLILNDSEINFNNRTQFRYVVEDNFKKRFGFHKNKLRVEL
jgi:asparagine synthase (glutamine-hydrolysing)